MILYAIESIITASSLYAIILENFSFKDEIWLAAYSQKGNPSESFSLPFFTLKTSTIILI